MNEFDRRDASRDRTRELDAHECVEVEEDLGGGYPFGGGRAAMSPDPDASLGAVMLPGAGMSCRTRWVITAGLIVAVLISWLVLLPHFSSPEAHADVIATIDEKIDNVLTLTAGSAGASALISAIPGDAGSPIADKLMDLSTGFLIVLAALFLEKYLITIFSAAALGLAFPIAALLGIAVVWQWGRSPWVKISLGVSAKLAVLGAVLLLAIPTSSWVTNRIDATYQTSMQESIESAEVLAEGAAEAEKSDDKQNEGGILGFFQDAIDTVTGGIASAAEGAQESLNQFIESLAVMLVTSCLIPILVLLFYFWIAKILLGVNIDIPATASALSPRKVRRRASGAFKGGDRV